MNITTEDLKVIYDRAVQYHIAKYGSEPDSINIDENGGLTAETSSYCCGSTEYDYEYFSVEDLSADLDELVEYRKRKEEQARLERQRIRQEEEIAQQKREKERRLADYHKLKKEFES